MSFFSGARTASGITVALVRESRSQVLCAVGVRGVSFDVAIILDQSAGQGNPTK